MVFALILHLHFTMLDGNGSTCGPFGNACSPFAHEKAKPRKELIPKKLSHHFKGAVFGAGGTLSVGGAGGAVFGSGTLHVGAAVKAAPLSAMYPAAHVAGQATASHAVASSGSAASAVSGGNGFGQGGAKAVWSSQGNGVFFSSASGNTVSGFWQGAHGGAFAIHGTMSGQTLSVHKVVKLKHMPKRWGAAALRSSVHGAQTGAAAGAHHGALYGKAHDRSQVMTKAQKEAAAAAATAPHGTSHAAKHVSAHALDGSHGDHKTISHSFVTDPKEKGDWWDHGVGSGFRSELTGVPHSIRHVAVPGVHANHSVKTLEAKANKLLGKGHGLGLSGGSDSCGGSAGRPCYYAPQPVTQSTIAVYHSV